MQKSLLLLALASLSLSSCAALTRYKCNREYAAKKGMEDAAAGLTSQPARLDGSSCEGEYSASDYSKDYAYGFQQKKQEICQANSASAFGRTDGETGQTSKPQRAKLQVCADGRSLAKLEAAYDSAFRKAFCAPGRANQAGSARASAWQEADYDSAGFGECGDGLRKSYMDAYKRTMANACNPAEAERFGAAEAMAGQPMTAGLTRLDHCAAVGKGNLKDVFERAYMNAKERRELEAARRAEEERHRLREQRKTEFVRNVAATSFPFQLKTYYSRCTVAGDGSYVQVEVENRHPQQVLIQGNWKVIYYNNDFAKITEDRTMEAILVTGNNRKTFQKMTLPRDAAFCRAEFVGATY